MRVLIDIETPKQVHIFKNMIWQLLKNGHDVKIVARNKDVTYELLNSYGFKYEKMGRHMKKLVLKILAMVKSDYELYKISKNFLPTLLISFGCPSSAQVSRLIKKPHIAFTDTEHSIEQYILYAPFTDVVCTPDCFRRDMGKKQVRFSSYFELCYLHPNYFKPNPGIFKCLGVGENEKYVVLRFNAFSASHDVGVRGFSTNQKETLVKEIERYVKVFVSSEIELPKSLSEYTIRIPPHKIHDALYHASLYVGDTGTMCSESAVLGTPGIVFHPKAHKIGNFIDLENKYGLISIQKTPENAIKKATELIQQDDIKQEWQKKRERLLKDKIDITAFMTWFIENYPESFQIMKENPEYQERFK